MKYVFHLLTIHFWAVKLNESFLWIASYQEANAFRQNKCSALENVQSHS